MEYLQYRPEYSTIIFIDESGFSLSMRRSFGRSLVGTRANLRVKTIRAKNISLIAAISSEKVWTFHLENGSVNQDVFSLFLEKLFLELENYSIANALLIMDNVRFHKTDSIKRKIEESPHKVLFLPPYSPFLNPIEEFFHQLKSIVRNKNPTNQVELFQSIEDGPKDISSRQLQNYCNHAETYFIKCLDKQTISN